MSIRPGSSLEVGRKPLRALGDDGFVRLEITDPTRSMSKRHAIVSVSAQGAALVRDLNSTNGSYIVGSDGSLKRLKPGDDFMLPGSPVRMQFGDVPIDFIRVDEPVETQEAPAAAVPNLFDYATADAGKQEPDAADMSVDDILNLRAGEPTTAFRRSSVDHRLNEIAQAAATSYPPDHDAESRQQREPEPAGHGSEPVGRDGQPAEHHDSETAKAMVSSTMPMAGRPDADDAGAADDVRGADQADAVDDAAAAAGVDQANRADQAHEAQDNAHPAERLSLNLIDGTQEHIEERDLFVDALSEPEEDVGAVDGLRPEPTIAVQDVFGGRGSQMADRRDAAVARALDSDISPNGDRSSAASVEGIAIKGHAAVESTTVESAALPGNAAESQGAIAESTVKTTAEPTVESTVELTAGSGGESGAAAEPAADAAAVRDDVSGVGRDAGSDAWHTEHDADAASDATAVFTPAFEPGSVFERVKQGEFRKHEPAVEVDGLTSDQAKATTDFTEQFAIARHPELLPFLAMNPSLYDDLYSWLAAQGSDDIDAALAKNAGYDEYRAAVGK